MVLKAKITFIRDGRLSGTTFDDVLYIYSTTSPDKFKLIFKPQEYKTYRNEFYMNTAETIRYIHDFFQTLQYDIDPFSSIQVDTAIHPTILFHPSDFDNVTSRERIEKMITVTLRTDVKRTDIEVSQ